MPIRCLQSQILLKSMITRLQIQGLIDNNNYQIPQLSMAKLTNIVLIFLIVVFVNCEVIKQLNFESDTKASSEIQASPNSGSTVQILDPRLEELIKAYLESQSKGQTSYGNTNTTTNSTLDGLFTKYNSTTPYKGQGNTGDSTLNSTLNGYFTNYNFTTPYKGIGGQSGSTSGTSTNSTLGGLFTKYNSTNPYKGQKSNSNIEAQTQLPSNSNLSLDELIYNYLSKTYSKGQIIDEDEPFNQEEALILVKLLKKSGLKIGTI